MAEQRMVAWNDLFESSFCHCTSAFDRQSQACETAGIPPPGAMGVKLRFLEKAKAPWGDL